MGLGKCVAALCLGAVLAAPRSAQSAVEVRYEEAVGSLVDGLEELATWCTRKRLYATRNDVYREILRFDPEHEDAHKGLGHKRDRKTKEWREASSKRAPKDYDEKARQEFDQRRTEAIAPYVEVALPLLELDEIEEVVRQRVEADVLVVDPDNETLRGSAGQVKLDGEWVLAETLFAKERRRALRTHLREVYGSAESPRPTELMEKDRLTGVAWRHAVELETVRVLGTGDEQEVLLAARALSAARHYFDHVFGGTAGKPHKMTAYLIADEAADKETFLAGHPLVVEEDIPQLREFDGTGFKASTDFVQWGELPEWRIDSTVRFALACLLLREFRIEMHHGWAFEGLGLYMTRELIGTRYSWFVQPSKLLDQPVDASLRQKLLDENTNWMNTTYELLQDDKRPKLVDVCAKNVNQLTTEDLLMSYVTAAYLVEAQPAETSAAFFRAIGKNRKAEDVSRELLGMNLEELADRVFQWLGERR